MSWLQGHQQREDLPAYYVKFLDSHARDPAWHIECITWFEDEPDVMVAHYYDEHKLFIETRTFRIKQPEKE